MQKIKVSDTVIFTRDFDIFKQLDCTKVLGFCAGCRGLIVEGTEEHIPQSVVDIFSKDGKPVAAEGDGRDWQSKHMSMLLGLTKLLAHGNQNGYIHASALKELMELHITDNDVKNEIYNFSPEKNQWVRK